MLLQRLIGALEAEKLLKAGYTKQLRIQKDNLQVSQPSFSHKLLMSSGYTTHETKNSVCSIALQQ